MKSQPPYASSSLCLLLVLIAQANHAAESNPSAAPQTNHILVGVNYFAGWWKPLPNKWHYNPKVGDWRTNYPERIPLLGEYNTQATMDREIVEAAKHGIDFFLILWYYNGPNGSQEREPNARFLNEGVRTFINSPEAGRMRFAIEFCNHPPYQIKTAEDWAECIKAWIPAFRHPSYLRVGGKLVFKVHSWHYFWQECGQDAATCRQRLNLLRQEGRQAGLGEIVIGCGIAAREKIPKGHPTIPFFDFTGTYMELPPLPDKKSEYPFGELARFIRESRKEHVEDVRPYLPFLAAGFNARPWPGKRTEFAFPSREEWIGELQQIKADLAQIKTLGFPQADGARQMAFTIYAWNEFGEGGFVAPTKGNGDMKLKAIKEVFVDQP